VHAQVKKKPNKAKEDEHEKYYDRRDALKEALRCKCGKWQCFSLSLPSFPSFFLPSPCNPNVIFMHCYLLIVTAAARPPAAGPPSGAELAGECCRYIVELWGECNVTKDWKDRKNGVRQRGDNKSPQQYDKNEIMEQYNTGKRA